MKHKKTTFILILYLATMILTACGTDFTNSQEEKIGLANPASVYCDEQGYQLEIREDDNGSYGVCLFPDGSECEEWAYFRGECSPGDQNRDFERASQKISEEPSIENDSSNDLTMEVVAIYGSVISSGVRNPSDSILILTPEGSGSLYITGGNDQIENQILAIQDKEMPANKAHFWGNIACPSMDLCLLKVSQMRADGPGELLPSDDVEAWEGVVFNGPPGPRSGGDDYFALLGVLPFQYGIDGANSDIQHQLEELRDTKQPVRIWGELYAGRMDWNGTQIIVSKLELIEVDPSVIPDSPNW